MRALVAAWFGALCACSHPAVTTTTTTSSTTPSAPPVVAPAPPAPPSAVVETLAADTPETTAFGNTFIAPAGWTVERRGDATILGVPDGGSLEGRSYIALFDSHAASRDAALAAAWQVVAPGKPLRKVEADADRPDKDGWTQQHAWQYVTAPNEKRAVQAAAAYANGAWFVILLDVDIGVSERHLAQFVLITEHLLPKGGVRESFATTPAHDLDAARIAALVKYVSDGEAATGAPGVAFGVIQHGKVVYAGGVGRRDYQKPAIVDADTEFMIASNTKQLTTLMLAKLVDQGKLTWDTPVTSLYPTFKLGSEDVTKQVLVKHLICACTGLPRQDLEWIFKFKGKTAADALGTLAGVQPTTKFGETFQYSNLLAAAAGFVGGHVAYPKLELGAAYAKAMQTLVFDPLGMTATTFDYARAQRGDHAVPHSVDLDRNVAYAIMHMNYSAIPVAPAGAGWSTVHDLLKYVAMELADGKLPNGKRYINSDPLHAREAPQVSIGKDGTYGMGLMVDTKYGVRVVHHGGDVFGYHSDILWLPEQDIGAVILTNGDGGDMIRSLFMRKLLEVVFDGKPEADVQLAAEAAQQKTELAQFKQQLAIPANPLFAGKLAAHYSSPALGDIRVERRGDRVWFELDELATEVATKANSDGSVSFVAITPGAVGFEFVTVGDTLVIRDAQHEYAFAPVK